MNHHMRATDSNRKWKPFVNDEEKSRRTHNARNRLIIIKDMHFLTDVLICLMDTAKRISENYVYLLDSCSWVAELVYPW